MAVADSEANKLFISRRTEAGEAKREKVQVQVGCTQSTVE